MNSTLFLSIEHTAIYARNSETLAEWYVKNLDFNLTASVDNGPGKPKTCFVNLSNTFLEVMPCSENAKPREQEDYGLAHLAILVRDFDAGVNRLDHAGVTKVGPERAGALGSRVQFYRDPDGNLFHLLWRPKPLFS